VETEERKYFLQKLFMVTSFLTLGFYFAKTFPVLLLSTILAERIL